MMLSGRSQSPKIHGLYDCLYMQSPEEANLQRQKVGLEAQRNKAKVRVASLPKQWQPERAYMVWLTGKTARHRGARQAEPRSAASAGGDVAAKSSATGVWRLTNARSFWDRRMGTHPGLTRQTSTQGLPVESSEALSLSSWFGSNSRRYPVPAPGRAEPRCHSMETVHGYFCWLVLLLHLAPWVHLQRSRLHTNSSSGLFSELEPAVDVKACLTLSYVRDRRRWHCSEAFCCKQIICDFQETNNAAMNTLANVTKWTLRAFLWDSQPTVGLLDL